METVSFPQPAGELVVSSRPQTPPSRSAASSPAAHHNSADAHGSDLVRLAPGSARAPSAAAAAAASQRQPQNLHIITDLQRGAPGDPSLTSIAKRTPEQTMKAKQTHQFYGEVFSYREPAASVKERMGQDSVVTAEVKTNVIIKDEYSFMVGLSSFLSQRYNRPESSILITLAHSTCLLLGGSFDPAYLMTVTALPSLVGPTTNKRNAALTQAYMAEELCVAADRGVIRFVAVDEASLATNGSTLLADLQSKTKGSTSRNFPAVPESPRSAHTEPNAARSFFSRKASKKSLKEPQHRRSSSDVRPGRQQEKQALVLRSHAASKQGDWQTDIDEGDEETAGIGGRESVRVEEEKSRSPLKTRFHSRKTSTATSDDGRISDSTAPTSIDEERARIAAAKTKMPQEIPKNRMDEQAEKAKHLGKRRSFRTMFGKL